MTVLLVVYDFTISDSPYPNNKKAESVPIWHILELVFCGIIILGDFLIRRDRNEDGFGGISGHGNLESLAWV